jgi:proteasome assembly chaperone (PAC2) family protein
VSPSGGPIRYFERPAPQSLRQPRAIVAFGGWVDAGSAGTGAVRFLISSLGAHKLADIDPEEFYSFTDTRPLTSVVGPGQRALYWPRGEFYAASLPDDAGHDLVLFVAPEPNLKWRTFATLMLDVLQGVGASSLFGVGSIFGAVHHRAAVPLTGWATDPRLRETLERHQIGFTNYEGPTGFITVLLAEAHARGLPAAAIFAFTPNYIQGVPNPRTSHALLKAVARVSGAPLRLDELERNGRALVSQVDRLLAEQPALREQVQRMLDLLKVAEPPAAGNEEHVGPAAGEPSPPEAKVELPSPQAVVHELEEFLKQLRERDRGKSDSNGGP